MIELIDIHEDKRGYIKLVKDLLPENREFTFLELKKDFARGGCMHTEDEFFVVIKGMIRVIIGKDDRCYWEGRSGILPKNEPHCFIAVHDSIIAEWGIKSEDKEKDIKDERMRRLVQSINDTRREK